ncbi:MAG: hypothetical protein HY840_15410 [Bacteroidetes bacterium]|nr:hypothetical protein [Bacteroidota bacterium]
MHNETSSALFTLIHAMNKGEKRYFKLYARARAPHISAMNYLRLFDVMERQKIYNEKKIVRRGIVKKERLRVLKHYLHNLILESLLALRSKGNDVDSRLSNLLGIAHILRSKGLAKEEIKFLNKSKALAYEHERWELLMEILDMERIPYTATQLLRMPHLNEEREAVLQKLNNINDYRKIHHTITRRIHEAEPMRTQKEQLFIAKLIRHPLLRDSKHASCAEAKTIYYEIWSLYYFFKRDFIKGYEISKVHSNFIETHLHQLKYPEKKHLFALNMLVIFIGHLVPANCNMYGEMQNVLQQIRSYPIASHTLKATFWTSSYINELSMFLRTGDFENVFPALKAIEENEGLVNQDTTTNKIILYYNIAYMLFGAGSYNEALRWIRKNMDQPANELRKDAQALTHILHLLTHYELHKDEELLDSLKRSVIHFLSTRQRLFKVEKALMHCLGQIMGKSISRKEHTAALQEFKTTLLQLMKNPLEKAALEEFDFLSWVESKIQNKTFAEVVMGKVKQLP